MYVWINLFVESSPENPDKENKTSYDCHNGWFIKKCKKLKLDIMLRVWTKHNMYVATIIQENEKGVLQTIWIKN